MSLEEIKKLMLEEPRLTDEIVFEVMDIIYTRNEYAMKRWIYKTYPHGYGLYD